MTAEQRLQPVLDLFWVSLGVGVVTLLTLMFALWCVSVMDLGMVCLLSATIAAVFNIFSRGKFAQGSRWPYLFLYACVGLAVFVAACQLSVYAGEKNALITLKYPIFWIVFIPVVGVAYETLTKAPEDWNYLFGLPIVFSQLCGFFFLELLRHYTPVFDSVFIFPFLFVINLCCCLYAFVMVLWEKPAEKPVSKTFSVSGVLAFLQLSFNIWVLVICAAIDCRIAALAASLFMGPPFIPRFENEFFLVIYGVLAVSSTVFVGIGDPRFTPFIFLAIQGNISLPLTIACVALFCLRVSYFVWKIVRD